MAYIPVPNAAQLELIYTIDSQVVQNVLHYAAPSPFNIGDLADLCAALHADWLTSWDTLIPTQVQLTSIRGTDMTTEFSPVVNYASGLPVAGARVGTGMPNNVSCVFTKRTALRGRSFRGRLYWPLFLEADVTANAIAGALVSSIIAALNGALTLTTTLGIWEMGVVSRYTNNNPRVTGLITPVTNFTSDGVVDSQRRRLPGRGS